MLYCPRSARVSFECNYSASTWLNTVTKWQSGLLSHFNSNPLVQTSKSVRESRRHSLQCSLSEYSTLWQKFIFSKVKIAFWRKIIHIFTQRCTHRVAWMDVWKSNSQSTFAQNRRTKPGGLNTVWPTNSFCHNVRTINESMHLLYEHCSGYHIHEACTYTDTDFSGYTS